MEDVTSCPLVSNDSVLRFLQSPCIAKPTCDTVQELISRVASTRDPLVEYACQRAILSVTSVEQLIQRQNDFHCINQVMRLVLPCQLSQVQSRSVASFLQSKEKVEGCSCEIHCQCNFYRVLFTLSTYFDRPYLERVTCFLFACQWQGKRCLVRSQLNLLHKLTQEASDLTFVPSPLDLTLLQHMSHKECNFIGENVSKMTCTRLFTLIHMNWIAKSNGHTKDSLINSWNRLRESIEQATSSDSPSKHWLVSLMLDDDTHLLNSGLLFASICLKLFPVEEHSSRIHHFTSCLLESVGNDYHLLLDWLTNDEETSVLCLEFLLLYLKVPSQGRLDNVTSTLNQLRKSLNSLTRSSMLPFDVTPLMRLLNNI